MAKRPGKALGWVASMQRFWNEAPWARKKKPLDQDVELSITVLYQGPAPSTVTSVALSTPPEQYQVPEGIHTALPALWAAFRQLLMSPVLSKPGLLEIG